MRMHFSVTILALAAAVVATPLYKRAVAYYPPTAGSGSQLDNAGDGYGEPLNVIISGLSSPSVLTDDGFLNFAEAMGFAKECLGFHLGGPQCANLGDGNGCVNQTTELRWDYGSTGVGTCLESLIGGNHLRVFRQNGPAANSGALFLAVSIEENVSESHTIEPNGYDLGRDKLVQNVVGTKSYGGVTYSTIAQDIDGLLAPGSDGVNHGIATDGVVTLLTVTIQ